MVEISTKKVKLSEIKLNPDNPRTISTKAMETLVKSLQEFPEMMKLREIVVDEGMTILGGNMRFRALQQIKAKYCIAKIVTGLTNDQKRRFVISDNGSWGDWSMDELANSWSDLPLSEWGVDISKEWGSETDKDGGIIVPDKDPNILVRFSFHPGMWLGKREELIDLFDKLKKTYDCSFSIEE